MKNTPAVFILIVFLCCFKDGFCQKHENSIVLIDSITTRLLQESKAFAKQKDYKNAIFTATQLRTHAEKNNDTVILIKAIYKMAYYNNKQQKPLKALALYNNGIDFAVSFKDYKTLSIFLLKKSNLEITLGDFVAAQKTAIKGLEISKTHNFPVKTHQFYNALANAASVNMQYALAQEYYEKALEHTTKPSQIWQVKNNMAVNLKDQHKYKAAAVIYRALLENDALQEHPTMLARVESNYGYALFKSGKKSEALPFLKKALSERSGLKDWNGLFASYIHLSDFYETENNSQAAFYARKALSVASTKTKSPESKVEALKLLMRLGNSTLTENTEFIRLDDSIKRANEKVRNDYTAAKFKSKEDKMAIERLKEQTQISALEIKAKESRMLTLYIIIGSVIFAIISVLVFFTQRQKLLAAQHKTATLQAQERERNKLSGNVHDTVAAKIREAMLYADHLNQSHKNIDLSIIGDTINEGYKMLRNISSENRHLNFNRYPFPQQLQDLLEEKEKLYNFSIDAHGLGVINWSKIPSTIKVELYRSIQEALINVSKYANATSVNIHFKTLKNTLVTSINDNGNGCYISEVKENVGLGDMRRRMELLQGTLEVKSAKGNGFTVVLGVPLKLKKNK